MRRPALLYGLALLSGLVGPAGPAPAAPPDDFAQAVLAEVNRYRLARQLAPLSPDTTLQTIAQAHSQDMANQGQVSHDGFLARFDQTRSDRCVESLAAGFSSAQALVAAWHASPRHQPNLVEPQVEPAGAASVNGFVTLLACRPRPLSSAAPAQTPAR